MKLSIFSIWSMVVGAVVPIVLEIIWWVVNRSLNVSLNVKIFLQKVTLLFWPTSFSMLGATSDKSTAIKLFLLSSVGNVLLYLILGAGVWYGVYKSRWFLVIPAGIISAIWWRLLTIP